MLLMLPFSSTKSAIFAPVIMEVLGYLFSLMIGVVLGLIGGGGSILTVPVLVYLFNQDALTATTYSLFVVGITSLVGSIFYFRKGLIHLKTALVFGGFSILTVFITRKFIVPAIPDEVFSLGNFLITKNILLLLLFAALMIASSLSMIRKKNEEPINMGGPKYSSIAIQGLVVGFVTGLVGAGGGFLIVPALVNFLKMDIKAAIGTSLTIIAINSLSGFAVSATDMAINWNLILFITALAVAGIFLGSYLATKMNGKKLKPMFGYFVLIMGIYIILKETILK